MVNVIELNKAFEKEFLNDGGYQAELKKFCEPILGENCYSETWVQIEWAHFQIKSLVKELKEKQNAN